MQNLTSLKQSSAGNITCTKNLTVDGTATITGALTFGGSIAADEAVTLSGNTPIVLTGTAITKGINFAGATAAMTDADNCFISYGTWNDEVDVGTHTAHFVPIQVHMHSTSASAFDIAAMRLRVDTDGDNTGAAVQVLQLRSSIINDTASIGTMGAGLTIDAACNVDTGEVVCGGFSIAGGYKATPGASNKVTVLQACNWNTYAGTSVNYIFDAYQNGTGNTVEALIRGNVIAGTATAGLAIVNTSGTLTNGITVTGAISNGMTIARGVTSSAIRIGAWKASQATGNAVVLANTMSDGVDTGQLDVVSVFGESVADLTGAYSAKAGRFRHLISATSDTVFNQETYGLVGQLVVKNGSLNHYHGGIMGTFETSTCDIQTSYGVGAVVARFGGSSLIVESGGLAAGFLAVQHMAAYTATGTMAAFATKKTATGAAWPQGIYMASGDVTKLGTLTGASDGLYLTVSALSATDGRIASFKGTQATPNMADGYGCVEIETTVSGTATGQHSPLSSWANITGSGAIGANIISAQQNGIYADSGANTGSTVIFGMRAQLQLTDAATVMAPFSLNTANRAITALFHIASAPAIGYVSTSGALTAVPTGCVPLFCDADGSDVRYVRVYSATT